MPNLRPTEIMVDQQLLVDRMSKDEITETKKALLEAFKDFDASVVIPNHPAHGPKVMASKSASSGTKCSETDRPVLGGLSHVVFFSDFQGAPKRARRAMDNERTGYGGAAMVEERLVYNRTPAQTDVQNELFSTLANRANNKLQGQNVRSIAVILKRDNQDPLLYNSEVFDQNLRSMCARWKLMLLTAGRQWTVNVLETPEVVGGEATVFVKVSDLTDSADEIPTEEIRGRKRSRSRSDREKKYKDSERRSSRGKREKRRRDERRSGAERRSTKEHGISATQLDEATLSGGVNGSDTPGVLECIPSSVISPTVVWTQQCLNPFTDVERSEGQQQSDLFAVLALKRLEAHLSDSGQRSLPLGGYESFVAHCPPLYVQSHHFPGSLCPTCCTPLIGSNCHECGPDVPCLRLDPKPIEGESREKEILLKYVPRPQNVLKFADRITLEIRFVSHYQADVWKIAIEGLGNGFLLHQDQWKPSSMFSSMDM